MRPSSSPQSLQALLGWGTIVASLCVASSVPLAVALRSSIDDIGMPLVAACAALGLGVGLVVRRVVLRRLASALSEQNAESLRFTTALENISQGLCFFDGDHRLIVANRRYAAMYGLSEDAVRPGTRLCDIVDARYLAGSVPAMEPDAYLLWRTRIATTNEPSDTQLALRNGKVFAIHHEPMPDGGWVATHEDVTERA